MTGFVWHANGAPYPGVAVGVWSDTWTGQVSVSEANGKYELTLTNLPRGTFKVAAVKLETCSQRDGQSTASDCQVISNIVGNVVTTEHCEGAGANQVSKVDFSGP